MITESTIYWITRLDYVQGFFIGLAIITGVLTGVLNFVLGCNWDSCWEKEKVTAFKWFKKSFLLWIIVALSAFTACLIPNTKEMCAIKIIPVMVNDPNVQELPKSLVGLANEWIEELKPVKN